MRRDPAPLRGPGLPRFESLHDPGTACRVAAFADANGVGVGEHVCVAQRPRPDRWGTSVALRLYVAAFAFGCLVTLGLGALQFYRDYHRGLPFGRTALRILAIHGAGALSSALFVACAAEWFILRHLRAIGRELDPDPMCEAPPALILNRRRTGPPDELDSMVLALNTLSTRLNCAHRRCEEFEARTDALAAELARASQASLANAQRLAGVGDWRWDAEQGVTHWSEELAAIVGFAPTGVCCNYARYLEQVHPDDLALVRRALRMVLVRHHAQAVDHRIVGSDGTVRIVQLKVEVAVDASGNEVGRPTGLVGTIRDVTERKRIERELLESREKLREFGAYMEATREDERKRIALEIHDELGQLLTALKMDVSLLKMRLTAPDLLQKVVEMRELIDKTIWMVRNVANHLRPAALNFGLVSALEWLAEDFSRRNQIPCRFRLRGGEPVLPEAHATAVFRVVQESLTNVARHAHATRVHVTLTRSERGFELSVSDNGCGFDPVAASSADSYGLLSMSERARLIGASLRIDSAPGVDTVVSISVPFKRGAHEFATELSH